MLGEESTRKTEDRGRNHRHDEERKGEHRLCAVCGSAWRISQHTRNTLAGSENISILFSILLHYWIV